MTYFSLFRSALTRVNPRLKFGGPHKQLPQHVRQNPAVLVIIHLDRRIAPKPDLDLLTFAVRAMNHKRHILARLDARLDPEQIKRLSAIELQRSRAHIVFELARQHTHSDEIAAMNALEALRNHSLHTEQTSSL